MLDITEGDSAVCESCREASKSLRRIVVAAAAAATFAFIVSAGRRLVTVVAAACLIYVPRLSGTGRRRPLFVPREGLQEFNSRALITCGDVTVVPDPLPGTFT